MAAARLSCRRMTSWPWKLLAAILPIAAMGCPADAGFVNYFQWVQMPSIERSRYVAGIWDSYEAFSANYQAAAAHYTFCIGRLQLTDARLAEQIRLFAQAKPNVQGRPMPAIVIAYLYELCGPPPP